MEIDFYKKSKSKNLLKRGFKKLKGKIQVCYKSVKECMCCKVHSHVCLKPSTVAHAVM